MSDLTDQDVLIVGAGPAGLEAALVLGRQQRRVCIVDAGRPRNAAVTEFHMYLGRDGGRPADLRDDARVEVGAHPNVALIHGEVTAIDGSDGAFIATCGETRIMARTVLLAGGVHDELADIPGLAERWGRTVSHCAYCDGYESKGAKIAVLAVAPVNALLSRYLADRFTNDVTLFASRIADAQQMLDVATAGGVTVDMRDIVAVTGEDQAVLHLSDGTEMALDRLFHQPEVRLSSTLPTDLGCELTEAGLIAVTPTMATSVPGVFAAGDAAQAKDSPAPIQFVQAAAADGQRAAVWIEQKLFMASMGPSL